MHHPTEAQLLRIFIGESDKFGRRLLYEAIVEEAQQHGISGATVLRGIMGFGADKQLRTAKLLRLSEDLPIVIEIVDTSERIASLLPTLNTMIPKGLLTLETIHCITFSKTNM